MKKIQGARRVKLGIRYMNKDNDSRDYKQQARSQASGC